MALGLFSKLVLKHANALCFSKDVDIKEGGLISDPLCCGFHDDLKTKSSTSVVILILGPSVILFSVISL